LSGKEKWCWDESLTFNDIKLLNNNMTLEKIGQTHWYCAFGNKFFTGGKHKWRIHVDNYPTSDWAGLIYGVCEE